MFMVVRFFVGILWVWGVLVLIEVISVGCLSWCGLIIVWVEEV